MRIVDACPAVAPDGSLCELERGHDPVWLPLFDVYGDHLCTEWSGGEPVGPAAWLDES
jgi:hypothetical protein